MPPNSREQWKRGKQRSEYARTTQSYETQGKIDVFLHEGLIDDRDCRSWVLR